MRSFAAVVVVVAVIPLLLAGAGLPGTVAAPATLSFTQIVAGASTTCAVTGAGGAKCWGFNEDNQVGDGKSLIESGVPTPVGVVGLARGVRAVSVGDQHACALTSAGEVKCWGRNQYGQLGNGFIDENNSHGPVKVVGLGSGVRAIATRNGGTCAITAARGVKCWGEHPGLGPHSGTPVQVIGLTSGVSAITAGNGYSCALMTGGGVKCWGENDSGQLGDNGSLPGSPTTVSTFPSATPVDVIGLTSSVKAIAAGVNHACAITGEGAVKCWGDDSYGQLGNASGKASSIPVDVVGLSGGVKALAGGNLHTCALTSAGAVKCWGSNTNGQLGNGSTTYPGAEVATPVQVIGLTGGVTAITAGDDYTCALIRGGGAKCWGHNFAGQLGNGSTTDSNTPVAVSLSAYPTGK